MNGLLTQLELTCQLRADNPAGIRFTCIEDLVLRHGFPFLPGPRPRYRGYPKACFQNCLKAVRRKDAEWVYCEGFAMKEDIGIALHHAWLARPEQPDIALDPTWRDPEPRIYHGIPIQTAYVVQAFRSSGRKIYGVLNQYWAHQPLLTGEHKIEDVIWRP